MTAAYITKHQLLLKINQNLQWHLNSIKNNQIETVNNLTAVRKQTVCPPSLHAGVDYSVTLCEAG